MYRISKRDDGFTIIESMISLVVLSIGIFSIMSMQIMAIKTNSRSIMTTDAINVAQSKIEDIINMSYNDNSLKDENAATGVFTLHTDGAPPEGYVIEWEVDDDSPAANTKTIKLKVKRTHKEGQKEVAFEFVKANF